MRILRQKWTTVACYYPKRNFYERKKNPLVYLSSTFTYFIINTFYILAPIPMFFPKYADMMNSSIEKSNDKLKKKKISGVLCRIWQNGVVACLCLWTVNHRGDIILPIQPTQDSDAQCNRRDLKDSETEPGLTLCVSFVSECFDNTELQFQKGTEGGRRDKAEELTDSSAEDVPAPTSRYADIVNVIYKPNICWIKIWWVNDWNT